MTNRIRTFFLVAVELAMLTGAMGGARGNATAQEATPTITPTPGVQGTPEALIDCANNPAGAPAKVFDLVAEESETRYRVKEELRGRGEIEAVGKTSAMIGSILLDANGMPMVCSRFDVDIRTLQSDESRRDNYLQNNTLEAETYPLATFILTGTEDLAGPLEEGKETTFKLIGELTFHGVTNISVWEVTATLEGDSITAKAYTTFMMDEFAIVPPKVGPVLSLEELVTLEIDITAKTAA